MMEVEYAVVIEKAKHNYSAYIPDLPGCVATGKTEKEVLRLLAEAIRMHIEGMIEDGEPIPPAQSMSRTIRAEVPVP
jgi:predicted RNase H-like HicB family nuclease